MNRVKWSIVFLIGVVIPTELLLGQGTAFTYQGQLTDAGSPANGDYDLNFRIFDADVDGNQYGVDYPLAGVAVANGLFTVVLDFGPGIFTGVPLWLEIEVNSVVLAPRQALTATPYAQTCDSANLSSYSYYAYAPWVPSGNDLYYVGGNIGIGTDTPAAGLHVAGGPLWTTNSWAKSMAIADAGAIELGYGASTRFGIGASSNNMYFFRTTTEGTAIPATYFMSADSAGRVAVGDITGSLTAKLAVFATGSGAELLRFNTERPWSFKQAYSGSVAALRLQPDTGLKNFEIAAAGGTIIATFEGNDAAPRLVVNGTTSTKVLQITGADLAEKFPVSDCAEPGTVMEIDPEHAGLLRTAQGAYNQRVAGVISGANNFAAGAILGHLPGNEDAPPIALSGRVWTWCDAGEAAIAPGDLLTTSTTPGHAMKAIERERSHGAIIGKAMSKLPKGERGLVLVLVNLQ